MNFRLRVLPPPAVKIAPNQKAVDETAANNIDFTCSNGEVT